MEQLSGGRKRRLVRSPGKDANVRKITPHLFMSSEGIQYDYTQTPLWKGW